MLFWSCLSPGDHKSEQTDSSHSNNNGPVAPIQNPQDSQNTNDTSAEHGEQDADDEAAEDTDDTRSVGVLFVCSSFLNECVGGTQCQPLVHLKATVNDILEV